MQWEALASILTHGLSSARRSVASANGEWRTAKHILRKLGQAVGRERKQESLSSFSIATLGSLLAGVLVLGQIVGLLLLAGFPILATSPAMWSVMWSWLWNKPMPTWLIRRLRSADPTGDSWSWTAISVIWQIASDALMRLGEDDLALGVLRVRQHSAADIWRGLRPGLWRTRDGRPNYAWLFERYLNESPTAHRETWREWAHDVEQMSDSRHEATLSPSGWRLVDLGHLELWEFLAVSERLAGGRPVTCQSAHEAKRLVNSLGLVEDDRAFLRASRGIARLKGNRGVLVSGMLELGLTRPVAVFAEQVYALARSQRRYSWSLDSEARRGYIELLRLSVNCPGWASIPVVFQLTRLTKANVSKRTC